MNKRAFLFVSLVSLAFLGCQVFFGYRDFRSYKELDQKQKVISEQVLAATKSLGLSISPWTTSLDEPVQNNRYAVRFGTNLLVLSKDEPLSSVYASGDAWHLVDRTVALDRVYVGLYGNSDVIRPTSQVFLPLTDEGLPVMVVEFRNRQSPVVFLGEYRQGKLYNKDSAIYGTALVFWRTENEYVPLGIYDSKQEKLYALDLPVSKAALFTEDVDIAGSNQYYVLSNDYMQLVISQESGAIEGINLPFTSTSEKSVVNEIGFDRDLIGSKEANFPGVSALDSKNQPLINMVGGYYPLLRRGLSGEGKEIPSRYHAFNVVGGKNLSTGFATGYRVISFSSSELTLESVNGAIVKTFQLKSEPYTFEVGVNLARGLEDLWISSGVPEVEIMSNVFVPSLQYRVMKKDKMQVDKVKLPKTKDPLVVQKEVAPQWTLNANGYFGIITTPLSDCPSGYAATCIPGTVVPTRLSILKNRAYPSSKYPGYSTFLPLTKEGESRFLVYAGPLSGPTLKTLDKANTDARGENPGYTECITFRGFFAFITEPFAALLFVIMKFFKMITGSWGVSIILLTVFLKVLLYPLNAWSIRSMRRMQILSPYIQDVQQRYKKEPKRAQMEIMALYKKNKVNPITGCLPLLIQLPFLIAMFDLLKSSFLLRGASFIPGWIDNLTAPDVLFTWSTPLWFIGNEFHLLPILLGLVMFAQQKMNVMKRKGELTDQQRQQEAMGTMMALLFTFMFYNFPSGLNIYWFSSMLLSILQQWATNKILDGKHLKNEVIVNKKR